MGHNIVISQYTLLGNGELPLGKRKKKIAIETQHQNVLESLPKLSCQERNKHLQECKANG